MMPGVDGLALARELKQQQPDLPIIASTGLAALDNPQSKHEALHRLGVRQILAKPYMLADLLAALQGHLQP